MFTVYEYPPSLIVYEYPLIRVSAYTSIRLYEYLPKLVSAYMSIRLTIKTTFNTVNANNQYFKFKFGLCCYAEPNVIETFYVRNLLIYVQS